MLENTVAEAPKVAALAETLRTRSLLLRALGCHVETEELGSIRTGREHEIAAVWVMPRDGCNPHLRLVHRQQRDDTKLDGVALRIPPWALPNFATMVADVLDLVLDDAAPAAGGE